jgi:hypothetical protein
MTQEFGIQVQMCGSVKLVNRIPKPPPLDNWVSKEKSREVNIIFQSFSRHLKIEMVFSKYLKSSSQSSSRIDQPMEHDIHRGILVFTEIESLTVLLYDIKSNLN